MVPTQELKRGVGPEKRTNRDGLFAGKGRGVGKRRKFVSGRMEKAKMKERKGNAEGILGMPARQPRL